MQRTPYQMKVAVVAMALVLSAAYNAYGQHRLDLTAEADQIEQNRGSGVGVGMGTRSMSGQPRLPLPLEVGGVSLSSSELTRGRQLVFEIVLKNVGHSPIELPWARKPVSRTALDPDERQLYLTLEAKGSTGERQILGGVILAGVPFSRSLLTLEPAETATIRTCFKPRLDPNSLLLRPDQTTDVQFSVRISRAGRSTEEIRSEPIVVSISSAPSKQR
jgi:hypothetical protein